jgi:hypothetical protein
MKNTNDLKLIDGQFSPDEAREILMSVFIGKIDFHENKNFSSEERFGKVDLTALKRIPELQRSMDIISRIIDEAKENNETLQITSDIQISLSKS